jgi:hypothetical protein
VVGQSRKRCWQMYWVVLEEPLVTCRCERVRLYKKIKSCEQVETRAKEKLATIILSLLSESIDWWGQKKLRTHLVKLINHKRNLWPGLIQTFCLLQTE